ncbi:MAG: class I SAM-dependent methyltransferase [Halobacteriales archaeon]|nr:class I SAM-dependent methyltransferase [Halobacteriales archaeon]
MTRERPSHRLFAALYDPVTRPFERRIAEHREYLTDGVTGDVLDLGAGTGANFPYFAGTDDAVSLRAVEPDPHMLKRAKKRAEELGVDADIRPDRAESLSYADDSFDYVVAGLVFCTIEDVDAALDEVVRVLRPGGELRFLEHVGDDGFARRVQETVNPLWKRCAGGCNLHRDSLSVFEARDEFETVEAETFRDGVTPVNPLVRGRMRKV